VKRIKLLTIAAALALTVRTGQSATRDIYPDPAKAKGDLAAALKAAPAQHKRILLDFGGNWCGDCHVLDIYFHDPVNRPILEENFVLVDINVGRYDANLDLARKYHIPLDKGVPALAVLSEDGKLLYSQQTGQFAPMRKMEPSAVTKFLVQWREPRKGCSVMVLNC
jgi:thiol:disulfide interchange protein